MSTSTRLSILLTLGASVYGLPTAPIVATPINLTTMPFTNLTTMPLTNFTQKFQNSSSSSQTITTTQLPTIVDYSSYTVSSFLPFLNQSNPNWVSTNSVAVSVNGREIVATIDTGSTGMILDSSFTPANTSNCYEGHVFYSSSNWLQEGNWCPMQVTIGEDIVSEADIFIKTKEVCCPGFDAGVNGNVCGSDINVCVCRGTCNTPSSTTMPAKRDSNSSTLVQEEEAIDDLVSAYLGIGFGRSGLPSQNIFWNVISFGDEPVDATYRQGYIVQNDGIHLGLTANDTTGFGSVKMELMSGTTDPRDWNEPPMVVKVNNGTYEDGLLLVDSGIDNAYLTAGQGWQMGDTITVQIPDEVNPVAQWTFEINPPANISMLNPLTPSKTTGDGARTELNTGRHFFNGFDVLVDPVEGYYGVRRRNAAGQFGTQFIG